MTIAAFIGSDDFWSAVIAATVAFLVCAVGAWATLRSVNPKKRLLWCDVSDVPLLPEGVNAGSVTVSHNGTPLSNPRLIEFVLRNNGRRDIDSSFFASGDDSLIFDLRNTVVEVVERKAWPPTGSIPDLILSGTSIKVKPGLISRGHRLRYSILVDGTQDEDAECLAGHLLNTPVKWESIDMKSPGRRLAIKVVGAYILASAAILVCALLYFIVLLIMEWVQ